MPKTPVSAFLFTVILVTGVRGQTIPESSQPGSALEPLRPGMTEDRLFAEMLRQNERRTAALAEYIALRTYDVKDPKGKLHAEEVGRMEFRAPDKKTFTITSEQGSGLVRRLALSPLIDSEIRAASGKEHHDSTISPANYRLELLGEQQVGPYRCFVAQAIPKRVEKYLFVGKVWIDTADYAVVRIEGHPAAHLSFWVKSAEFVRQYQRIDGFWLPQKDETFVQVRLYGHKVLTINHADYVINGRAERPLTTPNFSGTTVPAQARL